MDLKPWDPWKELERIQLELDSQLGSVLEKLRSSVPGKPIAFVPVLDIVETSGEYRLYLSIPGMVEEDIDITLEGSELILRGEREPLYDLSAVVVHQRQWKHGFFERRVQLPGAIAADDIQATYEAGVLTVIVPRKESA